MTLTIIQMNELEIITSLKSGDADALQFYCHDKKTELSYIECLPMDQFMQRIRQQNKRVHFPIKAVRAALSSANPMDCALSVTETDDVRGETGEEQEQKQKHEQKVYTVLSLKYRIEGAPAPLKWEWHLTRIDSALFYRSILKDALHAASYLNENLNVLLELVKKKDVELKQYRLEGAQLRRTTVATEPFDVPAFQLQHKQMLMDVESFGQVEQLLSGSSNVKNDIEAETPKLTNVPTTIPCISSPIDQSKLISPRTRKRKAMESGIQHVERKALQRRLMPQLQYKNTESQEDDLDDEFIKKEPTVKSEEDNELNNLDNSDLNDKSEDDDMLKLELKVEPDETYLSELLNMN
ncbi:uncharacterized protein LOC117794348 [Drosophila innubila]|uniref:uncharacterized protein LOC117794348 n=1 Tax=Drosophila innubila TaxID=198719 RepID=UPI00148E6BCE|nr:uncharacterized protein LOC117794348 [Drosophila innubila]